MYVSAPFHHAHPPPSTHPPIPSTPCKPPYTHTPVQESRELPAVWQHVQLQGLLQAEGPPFGITSKWLVRV